MQSLKKPYVDRVKATKTTKMSTELLRFTTAGSVDDGKSTLIGRLLYDSKSIYQDQYEAIEKVSERRGEEGVNLALLTDGLKSEREQGITIDVAYRYFSTPKRKFIIADTPGHIQYTRNMVTGASTANVALVLIDARNGVVEQTKRHAIILVNRSENMDWYEGSTLMYYLENVHIASDHNFIDTRFPVQTVIRPYSDEFHDYRGYAGRMAGGTIKVGDTLVALPSGFTSKVKRVVGASGDQSVAFPPQSVTVLLEDDIDVSRGDMLVRENNQPNNSQDIELMLCWFDQDKPLNPRGKYSLKHTSQDSRCIIKDVRYKLDIETLSRDGENKIINMNDIARVQIRTTKPLFTDPYRKNRITGSVILIDEATNNTVAAGMII